MQRYNLFTMIHKALRAMLYDAALTIQQTYFADAAESEIALEKIETVLYFFEQHAHHEDTGLFPAIEFYEPQLVADFEKEHVNDMALGNCLKALLTMFRDAKADEDKIFCGSAISKAFIEFMVFNLEHMAKEELHINQALWKHYTDYQLALLNQKIMAAIPPAEKAVSAKWMMRSVNNEEAVNWLKGFKESTPSFIFQSMLNIAEKELPGHKWEKVLISVSEPELEVSYL